MTRSLSRSLSLAPLRSAFPSPCQGEDGRGARSTLPRSGGGKCEHSERGRGSARAVLTALLLVTAACQLTPIYAHGTHGPAATALAQIQVAPIPDRAGYLLRQQLLERLNPGDTPRYRLEVTLDDKLTGFGVRNDTSISRERRALRARYRLVATDTDTVLLDATAAADEGIDVVQSEYAVVAAEQTALERLSVRLADQIVARVALYARQARRETPGSGALPLPGADAPVPLPAGESKSVPSPEGRGMRSQAERGEGAPSPR